MLRAGVGMVDRVDELTRLNRTMGLGQAMITHSLDDLDALHSEADRAKARGFVERAGAVVCGGLPARELAALSQIVGFTGPEQDMITGWSAPASLSPSGHALEPPGRGKFLIKIGSRTGIPVHTELVTAERASDVHNTNARWDAPTTAAGAGAGSGGGHRVGPDGSVDAADVEVIVEVASAAGITSALPGAEGEHTPTGRDPGDTAPATDTAAPEVTAGWGTDPEMTQVLPRPRRHAAADVTQIVAHDRARGGAAEHQNRDEQDRAERDRAEQDGGGW